MKKKIITAIFALSILHSMSAESFDFDDFDSSMFDGKHTELSTITVANEPEEKQISVFDMPGLAAGYVYHTHLKPSFYAAVAVIFKPEKDIVVEG